MGFFDFLSGIGRYSEDPDTIARMNARHEMILAPLIEEIAGATILDLAAHDGRWSFAFAAAGARAVTGIEGRADLIARFDEFPDAPMRDRITLRCEDIFDGMAADAARGRQYDIVAVLGILYHVMDHFRLFRLVQKLRPRLVIVDSEFMLRPGPVIVLQRERTDKDLNAIAQVAGQEKALIGIPSFPAMEAMADALGYRCDWIDWSALPEGHRAAVGDYFRPEHKRRGTCLLRPAKPGKAPRRA